MKLLKKYLLFLSCTLFLTSCIAESPRRGLLKAGEMQVKPAPEVSGAGQEISPHSSKFIFRGGVNAGTSSRVRAGRVWNRFDKVKSCEECGGPSFEEMVEKYESATVDYNIKSDYIFGTFEFLHKGSLFVIGAETGFDNGFFYRPCIGHQYKVF